MRIPLKAHSALVQVTCMIFGNFIGLRVFLARGKHASSHRVLVKKITDLTRFPKASGSWVPLHTTGGFDYRILAIFEQIVSRL